MSAVDHQVIRNVLSILNRQDPISTQDILEEINASADPNSAPIGLRQVQRALAWLRATLDQPGQEYGALLTPVGKGPTARWHLRLRDQAPLLGEDGSLVSAAVADALVIAGGMLALPRAGTAPPTGPGPWAEACATIAQRLIDDEDLQRPYLGIAPPPVAHDDGDRQSLVLRVLRRNAWQRTNQRDDRRRTVRIVPRHPSGCDQLLPCMITHGQGDWRVLGWEPRLGLVQVAAAAVDSGIGAMLAELAWSPPGDLHAQVMQRWRCQFAGDAAVTPRLVHLRGPPRLIRAWERIRLGDDQVHLGHGIQFRSSAQEALIAWLLCCGEVIQILEPAELAQAYHAACHRLNPPGQSTMATL